MQDTLINLKSFVNEEQYKVVSHIDGPMLVLAGAGSGKTRAIIYRIFNLIDQGIPSFNILTITFTNKATREIKIRVKDMLKNKNLSIPMQTNIFTFHSFGLYLLHLYYPNRTDLTIYDTSDKKRILKSCLTELKIEDFNVDFFSKRISTCKNRFITSEAFESVSDHGSDEDQQIAKVYTLYQKKMDMNHSVDFDDLIMKSVQILNCDSAFLEKMQDKFKYIMVDEYQDTSRSQYLLINLLARKYCNLCVVGDDDQSIYAWRGANIKNILHFEKDYPDLEIIKMERNYRCSKKILEHASHLIKHNTMRKDKKLWTDKEDVKNAIRTKMTTSEREEAEWITHQLKNFEKDYFLSDIAIMYRTNAQSRIFEDVLRQYNIPYVLVGGVRFYHRSEVKDILAYLSLGNNNNDDVSFERIINFSVRGIGKVTMDGLKEVAKRYNISLFQSIKRVDIQSQMRFNVRRDIIQFISLIQKIPYERPIDQTISLVLDEVGFLKKLQEKSIHNELDRSRLENVQELLNAAKDFFIDKQGSSLSVYLNSILLSSSDAISEQNVKKVTLMTVHTAKGSEYSVVFLAGLEEGLFPLIDRNNLDALDEERRLAYVGMTRAKKMLILTMASSRRNMGKIQARKPSRFFKEAGLELQDHSISHSNHHVLQYSTLRSDSFKKSTRYPYKYGDYVSHTVFGLGKVLSCDGEGDEQQVSVHFRSGEDKRLLLKYARLKIVTK